ncbi:unnamed protein product [Sympodiomycopsis kandeliae]
MKADSIFYTIIFLSTVVHGAPVLCTRAELEVHPRHDSLGADSIDRYARSLDPASGADLFVRGQEPREQEAARAHFDSRRIELHSYPINASTKFESLSGREDAPASSEAQKKGGMLGVAQCALQGMGPKRGLWDTTKCVGDSLTQRGIDSTARIYPISHVDHYELRSGFPYES